VFVDTPLEVCEARDPKGLYKRARAGEIPNFTGLDAPYEPPGDPEVHLKTADLTIDEAAASVVRYLEDRGVIGGS
jgi:adenylylsulfate kinase-like enzyme